MDASALHRSEICAPPASARSVRLLVLFGYMPASSVRPTDSRTLLRLLARATAMFRLVTTPVSQNLLTLSGCASHGPTPKNCRHGLAVSYAVPAAFMTQPVVRPSSLGPQLSSAKSLSPPPLPSTKSNSP